VVVFLIGIGVTLVALTAALLLRTLVLPRLRFESHLRQVDSYGFGSATVPPALGALQPEGRTSVTRGVATALGGTVVAAFPFLPALTQRDLSAAALYKITPAALHGYRLLGAILLPGLFALMAAAGGSLSGFAIVLIVASAALAWEGPAIIIRSKGRSRLDAIDRALPQFIDLIVASVEAGISFGGALSGAATRFKGPLGDELRLAIQQQALGLSTQHALDELLERCETPSVRAFVRAVNRAESFGTSIGPLMRHLAHDVRQRRRDLARERIQKAPIKLMFPLVLLILPALLMVIMFPAMYNLLHVLATT
jgi:tight adherence protein C